MTAFSASPFMCSTEHMTLVHEDYWEKLELYRESDGLPYTWSAGKVTGFHYWLFYKGIPIGYAKVLHREDTAHQLELGDIEIRGGFKKRGYASLLLKYIQDANKLTLYSTGGYTPEGHRALSGKLPWVEGADPTICYRPQTFVDDWDMLTTKHG